MAKSVCRDKGVQPGASMLAGRLEPGLGGASQSHAFDRVERQEVLGEAGFSPVAFFGDVAGAPYAENGATLCIAGRKK